MRSKADNAVGRSGKRCAQSPFSAASTIVSDLTGDSRTAQAILRFGSQQLIDARFSLSRIEPLPNPSAKTFRSDIA